ncbi:hypothetical protein AMTRI_Chr08g162850 [Amborella trichopoda]
MKEMRSLSGLGIGLSLVFGFLLLALFAELYYVLWWKKRENHRELDEEEYSSSAREMLYLLCWKKPHSLSSDTHDTYTVMRENRSLGPEPDPQIQLQSAMAGLSKDVLVKPYGEDGIETEIMRIHNLSGPPRFLFTIKEESREDLESEDGKSRAGRSRKGSRNKSLSEILATVETPFETPLSSPKFLTAPLAPMDHNHCGVSSPGCYPRGFNPLFESFGEAEINRVRASPPSRFRFLREAEEKLYRKKLIDAQMKMINGGVAEEKVGKNPSIEVQAKHINGGVPEEKVGKNPSLDAQTKKVKGMVSEERASKDPCLEAQMKKIHGGVSEEKYPYPVPGSSSVVSSEEDGNFITIIVAKNSEHSGSAQACSGSSQVLPLNSSPSSVKLCH